MVPYVAGIVFLVVCVFLIPFVRRLFHERTLRTLAMPGVSLVPGFWRPGGLQLKRDGWEGRVLFESAGLGNNYRRGHLRFRADFASPLPLEERLLRPEMRERLQRLQDLGGLVSMVGDAVLLIDGPLPGRTEELKSFLELCDSIVDGTRAVPAA